MVSRTRVSSSADRNALRSSASHPRSAHRLAILVKICIAVAPIARARGGALCVPPAIETWAPRSTSSSQTGGRQLGSFALSLLALNAGFFRDAVLAVFLEIGVCFLTAVFLTGFLTDRLADFFADFFAGFCLADFLLVFRRLAMERPSATRTVDWPR